MAGDSLPRFQIGAKLKAARQQQELSLRTLGERVGFSASFLSQVELGQVSPSLASLDRIAQALGLQLHDLLAEPDTALNPVLHRREEVTLRSEWSRAAVRSLLPADTQGQVSAVLIDMEPGGRTGNTGVSHKGKELFFCVRGKAKVVLADEEYSLMEGDSLYYDAKLPSRVENTSRSRTEVLLISVRLK